MRLDDIVLRYQKKIGSYDKQQWEKTLEEQKLMESVLNFSLRSTKLKTDLIDVDLVRGSTFPKAKPKQSLFTVLYLSILRYFFLPLYAKWWVKETSAKVFVILLLLYLVQMMNWAIYSLHVRSSSINEKTDEENTVKLCELLVPMGLSMLLCFVHSQIVATSVTSSRNSSKRRQNLNLNRSGGEKVRRKKKALRQRPANTSVDLKLLNDYDTDEEQSIKHLRKVKLNAKAKAESETHQIIPRKLQIDKPTGCLTNLSSDVPSPTLLRRRNVNWDSPIKSSIQVPALIIEGNERRRLFSENVNGDDGFESLTGKSSSGEDNLLNQPSLVSESETDTLRNSQRSTPVKICNKKVKESSDTDEENDDDAESLTPSTPSNQFETTDGEYIITSNSESECSVDHSADDDFDAVSPATILNPHDSSEKVTCTLFMSKHEAKKADMSVLDISMAIIKRVDSIPETGDYVYFGLALSLILSLTPTYCRLCDVALDSNSTGIPHIIFDLPRVMLEESSTVSFASFMHLAFGRSSWEKTLLIMATVQRLVLAFLFFFLLAVAERTFKQRFLYAKLFSHLTSTRRARKSLIPHFRLNKVRNIKAWLSVRSYLKRLGPQRSVDVIVSAAFITTLLLLAFLSLEFLKDSEHIHSQINLEALMWSCALGAFLLRFMTLGTKINKKYRSISVLITEQINLYVQIEQKPQKKEELSVSNSVLKLASDLLKELDCPFKISGLSANSYLYNTVKVVVLSALSGVLSEMLGFKLKLHKIKIK